MPHIDGLVRFVADELAECSGRSAEDCINDARVAVAAVRRFDLEHKYQSLNARSFVPPAVVPGMVRTRLGFEEPV